MGLARLSLLAATLSLASLAACENRPDQWDAFVYPDDDLIDFHRVAGFKSFELCQAAAQQLLAEFRPDGGGSYECGHKCRLYGSAPDESALEPDMYVCKTTRK